MSHVTPTSIVENLRRAGLAAGVQGRVLTPKGREWLRVLEDIENEEVAQTGEAADFVLSTNALVR